MFNSTTVSERVLPIDPVRAQMEALELAGKFVEKHITNDNSFPPLIERMRITGLSKFKYALIFYITKNSCVLLPSKQKYMDLFHMNNSEKLNTNRFYPLSMLYYGISSEMIWKTSQRKLKHKT